MCCLYGEKRLNTRSLCVPHWNTVLLLVLSHLFLERRSPLQASRYPVMSTSKNFRFISVATLDSAEPMVSPSLPRVLSWLGLVYRLMEGGSWRCAGHKQRTGVVVQAERAEPTPTPGRSLQWQLIDVTPRGYLHKRSQDKQRMSLP